jgi:hypothetical protein
MSYINAGNLPFTEMLRRHDTAGPSSSNPAGHDTAGLSTYEPHTGSYPQTESRHDYTQIDGTHEYMSGGTLIEWRAGVISHIYIGVLVKKCYK